MCEKKGYQIITEDRVIYEKYTALPTEHEEPLAQKTLFGFLDETAVKNFTEVLILMDGISF